MATALVAAAVRGIPGDQDIRVDDATNAWIKQDEITVITKMIAVADTLNYLGDRLVNISGAYERVSMVSTQVYGLVAGNNNDADSIMTVWLTPKTPSPTTRPLRSTQTAMVCLMIGT